MVPWYLMLRMPVTLAHLSLRPSLRVGNTLALSGLHSAAGVLNKAVLACKKHAGDYRMLASWLSPHMPTVWFLLAVAVLHAVAKATSHGMQARGHFVAERPRRQTARRRNAHGQGSLCISDASAGAPLTMDRL